MSESTPTVSRRQPMHRRAIDVQVFSREDDASRFDVEARLTDTKGFDIPLAGETRKAGVPVHEMLLTLVVDRQLNIVAAGSDTFWMPYPGVCDEHGSAYEKLIGLNLLKGFRLGVKERLAGVKGCTHLTELCQVLPTAVIQAFAGVVIDTREGDLASGQPPFQLDKCHALRRDSENVLTHYPRWYRPVAPQEAAASTAPPASSATTATS